MYKLYSTAMFNICLRITGNREAAQDALQESFVSAFKNIRSYRREASFGAWLKRIVVNTAISAVRSRQPLLVEYDNHLPPDLADVPEEDMSLALKVDTIKSAIQKLPHGFRVVFSLYLLEGYDHAEIAEILGVSVSTSKSQYNRAKKKLKQILKEEVYYG